MGDDGCGGMGCGVMGWWGPAKFLDMCRVWICEWIYTRRASDDLHGGKSWIEYIHTLICGISVYTIAQADHTSQGSVHILLVRRCVRDHNRSIRYRAIEQVQHE